MKALIAVITLMVAIPAFGQTTETRCTSYDPNSINCTSTTTPPPVPPAPPPNVLDDLNKSLAAARERRAAQQAQQALQAQQNQQARLAANQRQAQELNAILHVIYCRQNPAGSVVTNAGVTKSCADELAYVSAACATSPDWEVCKLPASVEAMQKQFDDLAAKYKDDPRAKKHDCQMYYDSLFQTLRKRACIVFPEKEWPVRDGSTQPCPNAGFATSAPASAPKPAAAPPNAAPTSSADSGICCS